MPAPILYLVGVLVVGGIVIGAASSRTPIPENWSYRIEPYDADGWGVVYRAIIVDPEGNEHRIDFDPNNNRYFLDEQSAGDAARKYIETQGAQ